MTDTIERTITKLRVWQQEHAVSEPEIDLQAALDKVTRERDEARAIAEVYRRDANVMQVLRQHRTAAGQVFDTIPIHFEDYQDGDDRRVACLDQPEIEINTESVLCGNLIDFVPAEVEFTRYVGEEDDLREVRCRAKLSATLRYDVEVIE